MYKYQFGKIRLSHRITAIFVSTIFTLFSCLEFAPKAYAYNLSSKYDIRHTTYGSNTVPALGIHIPEEFGTIEEVYFSNSLIEHQSTLQKDGGQANASTTKASADRHEHTSSLRGGREADAAISSNGIASLASLTRNDGETSGALVHSKTIVIARERIDRSNLIR